MRMLPFVLGLLVALGLAALVAMLGSRLFSTSPAEAAEAPPLSDPEAYATVVVPEFRFVDQRGAAVTNKDLLGTWTVLDFFFSNCPLQCPIMSGQMSRLQDMLAGSNVQLLSVSIDPERDTPERLRQYAESFEADPERWRFLTGEPGSGRTMARIMGFAVDIDQNPANRIELADGSLMDNLVHPSRFVVIDPQGRVVGLYDGMREDDVNQLAVDLKRAIARADR